MVFDVVTFMENEMTADDAYPDIPKWDEHSFVNSLNCLGMWKTHLDELDQIVFKQIKNNEILVLALLDDSETVKDTIEKLLEIMPDELITKFTTTSIFRAIISLFEEKLKELTKYEDN